MRRYSLAVAACAVTAFLPAGGARAQDTASGRKIAAQTCQACHGMDGIAKLPEAANLAGQDDGYVLRQLQAFKSGERKSETMATVAQAMNDQQMADVAAYYKAIEIEVVKPPGRN
jgi:cytochrome c553